MAGIVAYGAYIPRLRLSRMAIFGAMGWFAPAIIQVAQGERSMCNWDEDAMTMAVSAAQDCLKGMDKSRLDAVYLASTTLPFLDRQNSGILATALNLKENIVAADFTSSLKAGTTAMVSALQMLKGGEMNNILVVASDKRETKSAYFHEMWFGDGAASVWLGNDNVIAEFKGSYSVTCDFIDHYRGVGKKYDYNWEERWIRDEGYAKIIPQAVGGLMKKLNLQASDISKLVFPCFFKREHAGIAKSLGFTPDKVQDNMHEVCGETGTAHPLMMFISALENAKPGDKIILASFGQGSDALLFEVTDKIKELSPRRGVKGSLARRKEQTVYTKFLRFRGLMETEMGIRAEVPMQTSLSTLWRKHKMILGLVGGKCRKCGTPQFPAQEICVNPNCNAIRQMDEYEFSDKTAKVKTFTGDMLAVSVDPPAIYGLIQFDGGGRMLADFTDCELKDIKVGLPMEMTFRLKYFDPERNFSGYFWKAAPKTDV